MIAADLQTLRDRAAARRGWGPRTIGRLTTRVRAGASAEREWLALVYVADDDDQRRARRALTGLGPTAEAALAALRTRLDETEVTA